jgi:hypothetical protein
VFKEMGINRKNVLTILQNLGEAGEARRNLYFLKRPVSKVQK